MRFQTRFFTTIFVLLSVAISAQAKARVHTQDEKKGIPPVAIKTNLLYDATATINLGVEVRTGKHTSIELSGNYNKWSFKNDRKWKHYLVQPEFRWWPRATFDGHFLGAHAHWALYNLGNLPKPPFSSYMNTHRFEGWLAGAGISYGYRWNFNYRWAVEATVGMGYAYLDYDQFVCGRCGELLGSKTKHYFGPTKVGVSLIFGIGGRRPAKPVSIYVEPTLIRPVAPTPSPVYTPMFRTSFVTPEVEAVKSRIESGSAYLNFVVDRSEIISNFRNNAAELQKIYNSIEIVRGNPDVTISGISIIGHASPEGSYGSNMRLSERRAERLRTHLRTVFGLANGMIYARGEGEDWAGLDSMVADSRLLEKYQALEIIRGTDDYDIRERRLRIIDGGSFYRQILDEFYPHLRRSDYRIYYTVVPFSVEKGKEVFRSRPGDLSLNEMFMIAQTYDKGSAEYNLIFETAAHIFPTSDVANLNAAASALDRGDAISAARYLGKVRDRGEVWNNNMGVLRWLQGDNNGAYGHFSASGSQGALNASELKKHIESLPK